jgi:hypothetical protein
MAFQELSKRELAGLIAGATAANAIVGRITKEDPKELPTDQIKQWEVMALYNLEVAKDALALGLKRRMEDGAAVELGPYFLEPDTDTMEDLEDFRSCGGVFNCVGFNGVGFNDPAKPGVVASAAHLATTVPTKAEMRAATRIHQRRMEAAGETWDLQIVLSGDGEQDVLATLAKFKKRGHLKPDIRRRVIEAARAAIADLEREGEAQKGKRAAKQGPRK